MKFHIRRFFYIVFAILIPIPLIVWISDPLQVFHKSFFTNTIYGKDMRLANKGLIDHYDFDSVIFGASEMLNTNGLEASAKLGGVGQI